MIVELGLIEKAHVGTTFRANFVHRTVATCTEQWRRAQNSGDMSGIIKVINIEQAYGVKTFQA